LNNTGQPGVQVADIWNKLVSELSTVGSVGKLLNDNVGFGQIVAASLDLLMASDAETTHATDTYTKTKEILMLVSGIITVKFDLKSPDNAAYPAKGRIYLDGVEEGVERSTSSVTYVTYSEDITIEAGQLLQLYQRNGTTGHDCKVINFRIYGKRVGGIGVENTV